MYFIKRFLDYPIISSLPLIIDNAYAFYRFRIRCINCLICCPQAKSSPKYIDPLRSLELTARPSSSG